MCNGLGDLGVLDSIAAVTVAVWARGVGSVAAVAVAVFARGVVAAVVEGRAGVRGDFVRAAAPLPAPASSPADAVDLASLARRTFGDLGDFAAGHARIGLCAI